MSLNKLIRHRFYTKTDKYIEQWKKRNQRKLKTYRLKYGRKWRKRNLDYSKRYNDTLRQLVLDGYGGECFCCKESNYGFLTIDHIDGKGYRQKKTLYKSPAMLHRYLIMAGFPNSNYRIACYNCNCGRQWNEGICPHMKQYRYY